MSGAPFLDGDRVTLRTFEEDDLEFVRDTINDRRVWKSLGGQSSPTNLAQERGFFEDFTRDSESVAFIATAEGERIGGVELAPIDWEAGVAEIAYWIAADHQGQGYATDTLRVVVDYAFDQLRLHKLTAETFDFNGASAHVLETIGFRREGTLREQDFVDGRYVDVHRYGLLGSDRDES